MIATTFDPLRIAKDLHAAGIERDHAEALAEAMRDAASADHGELAVKGDLLAVKGDLKAEIAALRADLYRVVWLQGGAVVAIVAALRFLPV